MMSPNCVVAEVKAGKMDTIPWMTAMHRLAELDGPVCLALGVFDGVHCGHQAVIGAAVDQARSLGGQAVMATFDPHPAAVLSPFGAPPRLTSLLHQWHLVRELGVDAMLVLPFSREFAQREPQDFLDGLQRDCPGLAGLSVGFNWTFGRDRAGTLQTLKAWGTEVGIAVYGMDAVEQEGRVVSSTWLRAAVAAGELKRVQALCGRPWSVLGTVGRGQQLGRQLGFPTANVGYAVEVMPPAGVYACDLRVCGHPWMPALANLGYRPTVAAAGSLALEVHVLDWAGDLYGEQVEVRFLAHLRGEQKFESLEALKSQIRADVQERRNLGNVHS